MKATNTIKFAPDTVWGFECKACHAISGTVYKGLDPEKHAPLCCGKRTFAYTLSTPTIGQLLSLHPYYQVLDQREFLACERSKLIRLGVVLEKVSRWRKLGRARWACCVGATTEAKRLAVECGVAVRMFQHEA